MALTTQRIVLVEPDSAHREILSIMLEFRGYQVRSFANPVDALRDIHGTVPSLVILAFPLHMDDGRTLTEAVRSSSNVPILAIAIDSDPYTRDEALRLGCTAYCWKPALPRSVAVQVRELIGPPIGWH